MRPAGRLSTASGVAPQVPAGVAEVLLPAEQDKYLELVMGGISVGDSVMRWTCQTCLGVLSLSIMGLATLWACFFFCEVGMVSSLSTDDQVRFVCGGTLKSITEKCPKAGLAGHGPGPNLAHGLIL